MPLAEITVTIMLAVAAGVALLVSLWAYYDRRDRRLYDETRNKTTFHCLKCSHVYTSTEPGDLCVCPRCGHQNTRLRF